MLTQPLQRGQRRPRPSLLAHPKYRHKEEKRKLMKMTCKKLRTLEDPESVLCRAVLINNTLRHLQNSAHTSDNISGYHHKQTDSEVTLSIHLEADDCPQEDLDFLQSEIEFPGPVRDEVADDFLNICERLRHPGHLDHQSHSDSDSQVQEDKQQQQHHSQHRQEHSEHQHQQEHSQMHQHHRQEQEHPQHEHQQDLPQHQYQHYHEHPEPQHHHHHVPDADDPSEAEQLPPSSSAVGSVAAGGGATCAALSSRDPAHTLCMQCVA